jgi:hypothetical protein
VPEAVRGESGDSGLSLTAVGLLETLVADIAARGTRPRRPERRPQDG